MCSGENTFSPAWCWSSLPYLLAPRELELGSAQRLHHVLLVLGLGAHRHDHLTDVYAGHGALRLPKSTTHPRLEPEIQESVRGPAGAPGASGDSPVSSSAGQHLVDADDVEGVQTHADVEAVLAAGLHHVLVGTDTSGLQSWWRKETNVTIAMATADMSAHENSPRTSNHKHQTQII